MSKPKIPTSSSDILEMLDTVAGKHKLNWDHEHRLAVVARFLFHRREVIPDFNAFIERTAMEEISPRQCPFCGGTDLGDMVVWFARSEDEPPDTTATGLMEWRCLGACGRSFWA